MREALRRLAALPEAEGDLATALRAGADKLEGPWEKPKA